MDQDKYKLTRKPFGEFEPSEKQEVPQNQNLPPVLKQAMMRNAEKMNASEEKFVETKAIVNDNKLDSIFNAIREITDTYEEVVLPSRGRFYDESVGIRDGVIHVRQMTGKEEHIIGTMRYAKNGKYLDMIFQNCAKEKIKPERFLTTDRMYLLVFLRAITQGTDYAVTVRCGECGEKFSDVINLDSLNTEFCPDNFGPENLTGTLPKTKLEFSYRFPTVKDENMISDYRERLSKSKNESVVDDSFDYRASLLITDLQGISDSGAIQSIVAKLPMQDIAYLKEVLNDPPFGMDTSVPMQCKHCLQTSNIEMPYDGNFFFPKVKKGSLTQD